ncbi:MAG TPA: hypothetical protein VHM28_10085 [Anaerolineales bacterium]|nr:hypothetical protein [Anaerolineales bacterium]
MGKGVSPVANLMGIFRRARNQRARESSKYPVEQAVFALDGIIVTGRYPSAIVRG